MGHKHHFMVSRITERIKLLKRYEEQDPDSRWRDSPQLEEGSRLYGSRRKGSEGVKAGKQV